MPSSRWIFNLTWSVLSRLHRHIVNSSYNYRRFRPKLSRNRWCLVKLPRFPESQTSTSQLEVSHTADIQSPPYRWVQALRFRSSTQISDVDRSTLRSCFHRWRQYYGRVLAHLYRFFIFWDCRTRARLWFCWDFFITWMWVRGGVGNPQGCCYRSGWFDGGGSRSRRLLRLWARSLGKCWEGRILQATYPECNRCSRQSGVRLAIGGWGNELKVNAECWCYGEFGEVGCVLSELVYVRWESGGYRWRGRCRTYVYLNKM